MRRAISINTSSDIVKIMNTMSFASGQRSHVGAATSSDASDDAIVRFLVNWGGLLEPIEMAAGNWNVACS